MKKLGIFIILLLLFTTGIQSQTVYITKSGERYHDSRCGSLARSKSEIDLSKAKELGYTPCKNCNPIGSSAVSQRQGFVSTVSNEKTSVKSQQCQGKTKSGKRCSRKTKSANGRCYQH